MIPVHFGKKIIKLDIPDENLCFNLKRNNFQAPESEEDEIRRALEVPVGSKRLKEIVQKGSSVVIMVDDRTRKTPQKLILPFVLEELNSAGVDDSQIKLVIATGTHRDMTKEEILERFGEDIVNRVEIQNHNCHSNLVNKGLTRRGTRILVNKNVLDADIRIAVGASLPHHPTGWSGGAKMLLPGVAGTETVNAMHLLGATEAQLGKVLTPMREEMEDFAKEVGLHFIVNVILNEKNKLVKAVSGHFIHAHREIIKWGLTINGVKFRKKADITLSSSFPFDYDLTQADKGMFSAERATKPGGEIILLSPCEEGIAPTHEEEMCRLARHDDSTLWKMLDDDVIGDRFAASECMYLNYVKRNYKMTLTMNQPMLANMMGFYYLAVDDLQKYISKRIELDRNLKIGIVNNSGEILPVWEIEEETSSLQLEDII
ncbi:nickel-dependent lactate racemase [Mariniphaga sediminis]|uniref:Nickel-dependent lactate racemase n=1 Tax=Mariniphaga sediminis TaxID=1628158 RepID=A0A399D5U2_9BACT|nr:nickel-dependent lactate racemase [Mariniphaga sediminis]RIH67009.1 nickel-dependent lactate racemase [Mariniphaga sediminis]